jgi:hypothetical protein
MISEYEIEFVIRDIPVDGKYYEARWNTSLEFIPPVGMRFGRSNILVLSNRWLGVDSISGRDMFEVEIGSQYSRVWDSLEGAVKEIKELITPSNWKFSLVEYIKGSNWTVTPVDI